MDLRIGFSDELKDQDSLALENLRQILQEECDTTVQVERKKPDLGVKDSGLSIALAVTGLSLSAIGTVISALSYWSSKNPSYSISMSKGNVKSTIEGIPTHQLDNVATKLRTDKSSTEITVEISRK